MPILTACPLEIEPRLAIVISEFNVEVTEKLLAGALQRLQEVALNADPMVVWVPGAIEIPLIAKHLAHSGRYDAIIAFGAVIRGETSHFDYVCQQVSAGCQTVALDSGVPVIFGVLTTETEDQAMERVGGLHGHKGKDAIDAALATLSILRQLA